MKQPFEAMVRAYKNEADFHREAPGMESAGWKIEDVTEKPWRGEVMNVLLLGKFGARYFPPKTRTVVTYIRGKL
ncbi:MAG TPA: hypothetical protein VMM78_00630 [Thermomicrobiales bacterium]|nr:hypothetical protein [Thermomicrobiales bacterium]